MLPTSLLPINLLPPNFHACLRTAELLPISRMCISAIKHSPKRRYDSGSRKVVYS